MSTGVSPIYSNKIVDIDGVITLGTDAKSSVFQDSPSGSARRALRYDLQLTARKLLPNERVAQCMYRCGHGGVAINMSPAGIASYSGVVTCGSVWHCPVCSAKVSNTRRKELNQVLEWSRNMGYQPVLMTLTARHGIGDSLAGLLAAMKRAKAKFHDTKEFRLLKPYLVGHITATEVTHGVNGWHVHYHMICIVDAKSQQIALQMCDLQSVWLRVLNSKSVMLGGNGYAFDCQGAGGAGDYVSKWGAGEEVTLTGSKKAGGKGSTPFQLLAVASDSRGGGSEADRAAQLFLEYAKEFKGKRQLVWSKGLKRLLNIIEKTDEEVSNEPEEEDYTEVARISKGSWRLVCRRGLQAELLDVAEQGGELYVEMWILALHNQERLKNGVSNSEVG